MRLTKWIAVDVETVPGEHIVLDWLPELKADGRLKDADKVRADLEQKERDQWAKLSLDWYGARIASIAWQTERDETPSVVTLEDHREEDAALATFWRACGDYGMDVRTLVGYCARTFDVPLLVTRSRLLGVRVPSWLLPIKRYGNTHLVDLYDELTFDAYGRDYVLSRGLLQMCRNFGVPVPEDDQAGADIAALVQAGAWDEVRLHNRRDVERVVALAQRLGWLATVPAESAVAS